MIHRQNIMTRERASTLQEKKTARSHWKEKWGVAQSLGSIGLQ